MHPQSSPPPQGPQAQPARTGALKHEGDGVAVVVGLEGDDVVVAGALEHLGQVGQGHAYAFSVVAWERGAWLVGGWNACNIGG